MSMLGGGGQVSLGICIVDTTSTPLKVQLVNFTMH